jgi:hypothetical protein
VNVSESSSSASWSSETVMDFDVWPGLNWSKLPWAW